MVGGHRPVPGKTVWTRLCSCHTSLKSMQVDNWKGQISLEFILSYRGLWDTMWLLGTEHGSSARAADAFITGPSLQPLNKYFIWQKKLPKDYQIGYLPFGNSLWHGGSWSHSFCPGKIPRRKDQREKRHLSSDFLVMWMTVQSFQT